MKTENHANEWLLLISVICRNSNTRWINDDLC